MNNNEILVFFCCECEIEESKAKHRNKRGKSVSKEIQSQDARRRKNLEK